MPKAVTHSQRDSLLFQLPQELRDEIYDRVFSNAWIRWSRDRTNSIPAPPQPHLLGLLRTCQRIKVEVGDTWLGQVLFCFENPAAMLDVLTDISTEKLSRIRQVKILGSLLPLVIDDAMRRDPPSRIRRNMYDGIALYPLAAVLKLLPGLRLDQLKVTGPWESMDSYNILDQLITESSGWKELCYMSFSSELLPFRTPPCTNNQNLHPGYWQRILEERDGAFSKPSVTIYRAKKVESLTQHRSSEIYVQYEQESTPSYGLLRDLFLASPGQWNPKIRVIVKRGVGVDYEEKIGSPLLASRDIRRDVPGDRTWKWIKATCFTGETCHSEYGFFNSD